MVLRTLLYERMYPLCRGQLEVRLVLHIIVISNIYLLGPAVQCGEVNKMREMARIANVELFYT